MTRNAATYRFWDICDQNLRFWGPLGYPQMEDFVFRTHIYHRAEFHADRCHRRRDMCNRTDRNIHRITADDITDQTRTDVAFVDKNQDFQWMLALKFTQGHWKWHRSIDCIVLRCNYVPLVLLVLVFVFKKSLRTKLQSLFLSLSLMVKSLSLSWSLLPKSLSWSLMNCPWFCPWVQCYFKGNYILSNAELLTYLHSLRPSHLLCSSVYYVRQLRRFPWRGFLPRDAMQKRGLYRHAVFVCVSVRHVRGSCENE